jgi:quercetin dioxygenase-like cupin family protein
MKRLLNASLILAALALALPAAAQEEAPAVPVDKAPFHVPVFRNDYVALVNVYIPPGRVAGYHTHSLDQISVLVADADMVGQVLGEQPTPPRRNPRGNVNYVAYSKKAITHKVSNVGSTPFHNVVLSLMYPEPGRFTAGARADVAGYTQILDNERVRGWRLVLEPGQSVAAITQKAPGIRVVIDGGELAESVPGQAERGMAPKSGEFFWQEPDVTRAIRNTGTSRIQLVEFELK